MSQDENAAPPVSSGNEPLKADPAMATAAAGLESEQVDFGSLNAVLSAAAVAPGIGVAPPPDSPEGLVKEVVEDMLDVLRRLQTIEENMERLRVRVDQVDARVVETGRALGSELAGQRRELLGERKAVLARGIFNALVGQLDSLRAMRLSFQEEKVKDDKRTRRLMKQVEAVETVILTALQGMGFNEFHAREGTVFSPGTMECLGFMKGEHGVVLRAIRSGFTAPEGVVRPAGVYIAEPTSASSAQNPTAKQP